jgi:hypothetical protein
MFEQLGIGGVLSFDGSKAVTNMRSASGALGQLSGGFSGFASKLAGLALGGGMLYGLERVAHFALDAREQFEDMETTLGTTFNVLSGGHHIEQSFQLAKKEMP